MDQGNTSYVRSQPKKGKFAKAVRKNRNANNQTKSSSSAGQPAQDAEESLEKTRIINGAIEYQTDNGWGKFSTACYILLPFRLVLVC